MGGHPAPGTHELPAGGRRHRPVARRLLLGIDQSARDLGRSPQQGAEFGGFLVVEVSDRGDVAPGLDDQRAQPEWADTVLDNLTGGLMQLSAGQGHAAAGECAGET
jgi:hypothetical protein